MFLVLNVDYGGSFLCIPVPIYLRLYVLGLGLELGTHRNGDICREISWEKHMETGKYWGHKRTGDL